MPKKNTTPRGAPRKGTAQTAPPQDDKEWLDKVAATITHTEATALATKLTHVEIHSEIIATILLLIAATTYGKDAEMVYDSVYRVLMPNVTEAWDAGEAAQVAVLHKLRQATGDAPAAQ
jgi:uncharacterized membrane protein YgcG